MVREERFESDAKTSKTRKDADTDRDNKREGTNTKASPLSAADLIDERKVADKKVGLERSVVDLAMKHERSQKKDIMSLFLKQERQQTDKNLHEERTQTDLEVSNAKHLLTHEKKAHSKTKGELTSREEFLAIVSHDLKNPMGNISLCAEFLLDEINADIAPDLKLNIELIKRNADSALRLIADILDMERIARGKLQLELKSQDIGKIIAESIDGFSKAAQSRKIDLHMTITDIVVVCDRERLLQVLSNLIGNAVKFTPEGGKITLAAMTKENEVVVMVGDTGPGIPAEKIESIFGRYTQLGFQVRTGLGLGLYIAKMIIKAHGGRLWVDSKVGEGSTFSFSIPK